MNRYEDDNLWVYLVDRSHPHIEEDALEVERTDTTVTLMWESEPGRYYYFPLQRSAVSQYQDALRPTNRVVERGVLSVASHRIWETTYLSWEDEQAAREVLERKYGHVIATHDSDSMVREGRRITEAAYWNDVRDAAEDIKQEILSREIRDRDGFMERLDEYVDGHQRVVYTAQSQECLLFSRHDAEAVNEGIVDASSFKDGIPWAMLAYEAFKQDVLDRLGEDDEIDFNDEDLGRIARMPGFECDGNTFCEDCGEPDCASEEPKPIEAGQPFSCDYCGTDYESA